MHSVSTTFQILDFYLYLGCLCEVQSSLVILGSCRSHGSHSATSSREYTTNTLTTTLRSDNYSVFFTFSTVLNRLHEILNCCLVTKSCPTLLQLHGLCSLPGSSVDGIFQARILEWITIFFSR